MEEKNLIGLRSRGGNNRPFLVVENLQKNAELLLKEKEDSLKNDLQDTEKKLKELTENNDIDQQNLTLEQTETINNFNKKIFQIRKDLREVQRELGENIKKLETNLKLINIWLMPLLVIVVFFIFKYYTNRKYKKYINTI